MDKKYTYQQFQQSAKFNQTVQVGDFILTQKDSLPYSFLRSALGIEYDHLMVVIKGDQLLHIGWPKIRVIHPIQIIDQSSKYCILRPKFKDGEVQKFITLLQTSLDHDYDYQQLIKGMTKKLLNRVPEKPIPYEPNLQKKRVCTDLVFYSLEASSQIFRETLPNYLGYLDYTLIGSFTPDDAYTLAKASDYFQIIQTTEIQKPQNTLKNIKNMSSVSIQTLLQFKNFQLRRFLKKIEIPEEFQESNQLLVFGLNLFQFYFYSRNQKIRKLVQLVLKKHPTYKNEAKVSKATKKVILFVDFLELIINPLSIQNHIKLLKTILNIAFLNDKATLEMTVKYIWTQMKVLSSQFKPKL